MIGGTGLTRAPCATCEIVRQHERHADRRQHRREAERMPQRPVGDALDGPAVERGDRHRHQQHDQQDQRDRGEAERDQHQERDQRDEAADHEDVAMGEIDHADDAVDHRVADRDQAVDRAEHEAVDELLGEIIHALPLFEHVRQSGGLRRCVLTIRGDGPGSRNDASCRFLTAGTGGGNSAAAAKGLVQRLFWQRFRGPSRDTRSSRNDRRGTWRSAATNWRPRVVSRYVQQGRSR